MRTLSKPRHSFFSDLRATVRNYLRFNTIRCFEPALQFGRPHAYVKCDARNERKSELSNEQKGELMKIQKTIVLSIAMVMLSAIPAMAQQVKTDFDRSANFNQYKTYSWSTVKASDPLWVDRIKSAVDSALAAKGWTQIESGGDVSITAMEITKNQQTLNTFYDGGFGGWRWGGFGNATTTTETYKVGTLVVDLFDTHSKKLIWRGSSSDTLSNKSEKNIKNLNKGVGKMFKHFPPEIKG
jgi:hypothetical protein